MRRREVLGVVGGATVWPLMARAQEAVPAVGFLHSTSRAANERLIAAFSAGLREVGFTEAQNVRVDSAPDFAAAFRTLRNERAGALVVEGDPFFDSERNALIALARRHGVPAIYHIREFPVAGGLVSYGPSLVDSYEQLGGIAGRVLKGERPADLPVMRPTKFELVLNMKTANALRVEVPLHLQQLADEVIE